MTRRRVLISPTSTDSSIAIMRSLARAGLEVAGADDGHLPTWLRSRHCHRYHRVAGAGDLTVTDYLPDIIAAATPDAIVPVNTPATMAVIHHRASLNPAIGLNLPSRDSFEVALDKHRCLAACRELGIPCPAEYEIDEAAPLLRTRAGTRLVVKPRLDFGGGHGMRIVDTPDALKPAVDHCIREFDGAVIQEHIPGDASCLHMLLVLFSPDSRLVSAFTSRKIRQHPREVGASSLSESTSEAGLISQMMPLFEHLRWRGPAEVDLKFDERDRTFKVLEVNPRFPSYMRLVAECGLDMAHAAAAMALDPDSVEPLPFPSYAVGTHYICLGPYLRGVAADLAHRGQRLHQLAHAWRDARGASLAEVWDDPLPFIGRTVQRMVTGR